MAMSVKAGLPGKISVELDGQSYQLDHSADLYNGLHALAEQVNGGLGVVVAPPAPEPAPEPAPAPDAVETVPALPEEPASAPTEPAPATGEVSQ